MFIFFDTYLSCIIIGPEY